MQEEIWKDVPGFEGYYQVSDLGRVRSLERKSMHRGVNDIVIKGKPLKPILNKKGYCFVGLSVKGKVKSYNIHVLVAMAFLGHTPNGNTVVVDHINMKRDDNRLENLRLITNRENVSVQGGNKSGYTGVSWFYKSKKWGAQIGINGKRTFLGGFATPEEAGAAYQKALEELNRSYGIS
jgi:hypothetical protein